VTEDLTSVAGERVVVLITDGEETCDGDPAAAIETLKAIGMDVRVNIVGFAIDDTNLKESFRYWASLGGGEYHDARSAKDLDASLTRALRTPFDVFNQSGQLVTSGLVGDVPIVLPAGTYTIRTRVKPRSESTAVVVGGKDTTVTLTEK